MVAAVMTALVLRFDKLLAGLDFRVCFAVGRELAKAGNHLEAVLE